MTPIKGFFAFTGTTPLTNVGTNSVSVATMTGATGVKAGDKIIATPKAALAAAVAVGGVRVVGNNSVVVSLVTPGIATAGSQAAVGWDCIVLRT